MRKLLSDLRFIRCSRRLGVPITVSLAAGLLVVPAPGSAQSGGEDFLFRPPAITLSLRAGYGLASADSDIFDESTRLLTLERSDFHGPTLAADAGVRISDRFDLVLGGGFTRARARSEDVEFVEELPDGTELPIEQTTTFTRVPLDAGVRFYLMPRGRSIGRFAWVPQRLSPYVGAGVGAIYYKFRQRGDFVDYEDLSIFSTTYESSGWTESFHLAGGVELTLSKRAALTAQGRYLWAEAELDRDFEGFDPIDLSGFQTTFGISLRL